MPRRKKSSPPPQGEPLRGPAATPKGDATRAEILRVAKSLFAVHGYHATGIADVFEATGLSKGAFYYHFAAKQDLAVAILDHMHEEYATHLMAPAMAQPTPGARLREAIARAVHLNRQGDWCNCRVLATFAAELTEADGVLRDRVTAMQKAMFDTWLSLVSAAQASGEVRSDVPAEALAQAIVFLFGGFLLARKLEAEQMPAETVFESVLRLLMPSAS